MMPIRWPFASNLLLPAESKNGRGMDWNHRRRYAITLKFTHTHAMDRESLRENYWGLSWFVAATCTDASNMGLYLSRSGSFYHIFPHIVTHALTPVAHGSNHGGYTDIYRNLTGERILVKLWVIKHCFRLAFLVLCVSGTPKYENML